MGTISRMRYMRIIHLLALVFCADADYTCICNYDTQRTVFSNTSDISQPLGLLTYGDCYEVIQAQLLSNTWSSISYRHQVGYIKKDANTDILLCHGSPSDNNTATSVGISHNTTMTILVASTTVNTTMSVQTRTTLASNTITTLGTLTATPNATLETITKLTVNSTTEAAHICPQAVYKATTKDNATLIFNHAERKCYEFVQSHQTWSVAEESCQKNGGHLVTVRNVNESNELYEYVKAYGHSTWLGLNDKNDEGNFTWVSGEVSSYTNWRPGHTNWFVQGSEDCVCMLSSSGQWEDISCSNSYAYMCEYASIPNVSGNSGTQASLGSDGNVHLCPTSFIFAERTDKNIILGQYGDSCYVLTNGSKVTWTSAESTCKHNGGHLAHIRNADEQNFIEEFMNRHSSLLATWIGLRDTVHEGQFQWSSGEAVTYTNWVPGFNGTHHSSEDCVVLLPNQTGKWDEVYCGQHGSFFSSQTERHQVLCQYKNEAHVSSILIG